MERVIPWAVPQMLCARPCRVGHAGLGDSSISIRHVQTRTIMKLYGRAGRVGTYRDDSVEDRAPSRHRNVTKSVVSC